MKSHEEQQIQARAGQVREKLQGLEAELSGVEGEIEELAPQRMHHDLLDQACGSLEKLDELGVASLFWGDQAESARVTEQLRGVRSRVSAFQAQMGELDARRQSILAAMGQEQGNLEVLGEDLYDLREAEERRKLEWVVERDISALPRRTQRMAWARGGEDDKRFRKTLAASFLVSVPLGLLMPMINLPLPKRFLPEEVPKRLVQLVRQEQAKMLPPPAPEPPPEQKPKEQERPEPQEEPKPTDRPDPQETPVVAEAGLNPSEPPGQPDVQAPFVGDSPPPENKVGRAGILAFREKFASLAKDDVAPRLGADARYTDADDASGASTRSMLTTNAPGSSGGINLASLSRNLGGGGGDGTGGGGNGGGMQVVQVGRATSAIAGLGGGGDRPLARGGPGASRTDEEIQIVFDRYKARFYRLYNRELRNDPTLRGQMVLRLTIEPDGSVSMCRLQSSDMEAPDLASQVVDIVRTINFGAKDVMALTIVYPIDFLPAYEADS